MRAAVYSIAAATAALFAALSLGSQGAYGIQTSYAERKTDLSGFSVIEKNHEIVSAILDEPVPSSETNPVSDKEPELASLVEVDTVFVDRFAAALDSGVQEVARSADADDIKMEPSSPEQIPTPLPSPASKKRPRVADIPKSIGPPVDANGHTAIYDIASHTVYMPNGRRLEAHSGLGDHLDIARDANLKSRGPTPPNVYSLTLREQLFHGVRAIRLTPVGDGEMFGRDGMLAHPYMLGPNGQSNGCVSFRDYAAFLNAYLAGEVDRLVVVDNLPNAPAPDTASPWLPGIIKTMFTPS